jgi:hypothetical protein
MAWRQKNRTREPTMVVQTLIPADLYKALKAYMREHKIHKDSQAVRLFVAQGLGVPFDDAAWTRKDWPRPGRPRKHPVAAPDVA